jgi:hypothetical protein
MKRLTTLLVTGFLVGVLPAAIAQNVTVPNTFSAGTIAKAAEVNADFDALVKAFPGVSYKVINGTSPAVTSSYSTVNSITINAPRAGYALVRFIGSISLNASEQPLIAVSSSSSASSGGEASVFKSTDAWVTSISTENVFAVGAAGSATYYLLAKSLGSGFTITNIQGMLTVEFFPNTY